MDPHSYPPIDDYGFIADCHSAALVSRTGSIDWCCMPRIDSSSCFGRILDWKQGGYCCIAPISRYESSRRYLDQTLVLETIFKNEMTGNFPQGLTHLSLIRAAVTLNEIEGNEKSSSRDC